MAKWYGKIGYAEMTGSSTGVWTETITEKYYAGDIIKNSRKYETSDKLNDDINISNKISIVADPYAVKNFHLMRYIEFMDTKWKIHEVEVAYPRLILSIGGLYNG